MRFVARLLLAMAIGASVVAVPDAARATGGEGETWPSFTESSSCGAQRITTAHAPDSGGLGRDFILRGDYGAYFGRTVQEVFDAMVRWRVPGSSDHLAVHPWIVPALDQAADVIERELADGASYRIDPRSTFSASARTIRGSIRISRHTYGIAFDVNAPRNPFRQDNTLVTDLPGWWVAAFSDAGFCWGGSWIGSKDAMHFAWQGPAFSGYDSIPAPLPPLTRPTSYTGPSATKVRVEPRPIGDLVTTVLADVTTNGAVDVVRISVDGDDVIIDASVASRRHNACSARRSVVHDFDDHVLGAHTVGFGDWDGRGGTDLWTVEDVDGSLRLTVRWAFGGYSAETSVVTDVPTPSSGAWITTADVDVDGALDLVVADRGRLTVWDVDPETGATNRQLDVADPFPAATARFLGDVDLDNRPDLMAIVDGFVATAEADDEFAASTARQRPAGLPADPLDVVGSDYDGDGRVDVVAFDGIWKRVWLGNTPLPDGEALETWFEADEPECDEFESTWQRDELRFSTSGWVAIGSHEWRDRNGLPVGCDPEGEDCRPEPVTVRSFAEFLAWIDGLSPVSPNADQAAAFAVERAGYALPCAADDRPCLASPMLRTDVSAYFGMFLADRHGAVPDPHRWALPTPIAIPSSTTPR